MCMIFFAQQEKLGKIIWCECDWKQCWVSASCFNHQTTASQYLLGDTLDFITKAIDSHNINIWSTFYTGSSITHSLNLNPKVELSCSSHRLKQQFPTSSPLMSWHKKVAKVKLPFQAEKVYSCNSMEKLLPDHPCHLTEPWTSSMLQTAKSLFRSPQFFHNSSASLHLGIVFQCSVWSTVNWFRQTNLINKRDYQHVISCCKFA